MDWKDPESLLMGTTASIIVKDMIDQNPDVAKDIPANHTHKRLSQYLLSPTESMRLVGMNTIARFSHVQTLFQSVMKHEKAKGFRYEYILLTRDDDHYIGPLKLPEDMTEHVKRADADNQVFYKYCNIFGGMNDKTLLFGRAAAGKVLSRLYSDFWKPLPDEEQVEAPNPEIYLKRVIFARGASVHGVIWENLPTADAVYEDGPEGHRLCVKPAYWPCGHRAHPSLDKVVFCGEAKIGVIGNDHPVTALLQTHSSFWASLGKIPCRLLGVIGMQHGMCTEIS